MATLCTKPIRREVVTPAGTRLIVTLTPEGVTVREKGRRTTYGPVPFGTVFGEAIAITTGKPRLRPRPPKRGGRR